MKELMKKNSEWGLFFPKELSPFAYNEAIVNEYMSLSREEALSKGFKWKDNIPSTKGQGTIEHLKLPKNLKERLMEETDQMGLVVKTKGDIDRTKITVFFPIVYNHELLGEYSMKGYFIKRISFYDYGFDGTLDGLDNNGRERFKNTIKASERVLREDSKKRIK